MFLAFKEMARAKVRFALLIAAIALLVFLILFQQSLQNGLITGFIGAIREQSAPVLVYSVDGQRVIQGSVITPPMEEQVRSAAGVGEIGRIGQGTFTGVPSGNDDGETFDVTVLGYELGADGNGIGAPTDVVEGRLPNTDGEAVVSDADVSLGFGLGDTVTLLPGGRTIEIVGVAANAQLNVAPTLFASYDTYVDAVKSVNPDAGDPLPNVVPPGPDNPLGKLAMQLEIPGYFIHGTNKPFGVGQMVSHGCIRLYDPHIETLVELARNGTPVYIVNEPFKVGWTGDVLYAEVHEPLYTKSDPQELARMVAEATKNRASVIDWARLDRLAEAPTGVPVRI